MTEIGTLIEPHVDNPDGLTIELDALPLISNYSYKVSTYNAVGESTLSAETMVF